MCFVICIETIALISADSCIPLLQLRDFINYFPILCLLNQFRSAFMSSNYDNDKFLRLKSSTFAIPIIILYVISLLKSNEIDILY